MKNVRQTLLQAAPSALMTGVLILCGMTARTAHATPPGEQAKRLIRMSGVRGGLVVHVGCGDGGLTAALRRDESYVVQGLDSDRENVRKAREHICSLGVYGPVSVDYWSGGPLPYSTNLVNLLVVENPETISPQEMKRVLAPGGEALVRREERWIKKGKKWPAEIDEWTHWRRGPDGNPVAEDSVVGPPRHLQWVAEPRWQTHHNMGQSVAAAVSAGGRIFYIVNDVPPGIRGMPGKWYVMARDAFSGIMLWKRHIPDWGWKKWADEQVGGRFNKPIHLARRLVATDDRVYVTLGFNAPVTALEAATGEVARTYKATKGASEIVVRDGVMYLSVNQGLQAPGQVEDKPPVKKHILAVEVGTGDVRWETGNYAGVSSSYDERERIRRVCLRVGADRAFFVDGGEVVALDLDTGRELWRTSRPTPSKARAQFGYYATNLFSLVYESGVVLLVQPEPIEGHWPYTSHKATIVALSSATGEELWRRGCHSWGYADPPDIFIIDGLVWAHDAGPSYSMMGLKPGTGNVQQRFSTEEAFSMTHHHRCYRDKASSRYIMTARRGVEFLDTRTGENLLHHWIRGTCRLGILPSNGLLYVPPHPCVCYMTAKLNGFYALAPERGITGELEQGQAETVLRRGPAYDSDMEPEAPESDEWPTYRHDTDRSAHLTATVPDDMAQAWEAELPASPSSLTMADGKLFVASTDSHTVYGLDAGNGQKLWRYIAGGRVDTPPTYHRGRVYFGAHDGWVYCLDASDGSVAWRSRVAPTHRMIIDHGQLASAWALHGSVLIYDNRLYVCAGHSSFLDGGIYVYALDPRTGKVMQRERIWSVQSETSEMARSELAYDMPPEHPGALSDILVTSGESIYMRHMEFNPEDLSDHRLAGGLNILTKAQRRLQERQGPNDYRYIGQHPGRGPQLLSNSGLLDDSWFNQSYWTVAGIARARMLAFSNSRVYGLRAYQGSSRHSRDTFAPGEEDYTLFAMDRKKGKKMWNREVPLRVRAMACAGDKLFVAGPPNIVPEDDPWAAFDGQMGAELRAYSVSDGENVARYALDARPAYDGLIAAAGRLYVSLQNGHVECFENSE